jgi:transposase
VFPCELEAKARSSYAEKGSQRCENQSHPSTEVLQGGIAMKKQGLYLTPFQRKLLLKSLQTDLRPEYCRRIEIMLLADTGQSQAQICKALGCSPEMARYWIVMAQTGQAHHWNDHPMGRPKTVNEQYLARLRELVSHNPREYGYPFQRWTAQWLGKHLAKELGIKVSDCHINRLLKEMGLSTRQRRESAQLGTDGTKDSNITIRDLQSSPDPNFLWSLNLIKTSS